MNDLVIQGLDDLKGTAKMLLDSGMFPAVKQLNTAMVLIMAGMELNIKPFASLKGLQIIQGKVVMSAGLMATLVKRSTKYNYRIVPESGDMHCTLEWFENGESVGSSNFTMEEAKAAGLAGKDVWKKYASDMLFARALTRGVRRYAPDVLGGDTYVQGEIEAEPINVTPQAEPVVEVKPALDPLREQTIVNIKGYIRAMNDDERQAVKNEYMTTTGKDFPESNWQGLATDQLQLLEVMLAKKADGDNGGRKAIEQAFDSVDPKARAEIKSMFSAEFGDWIDIDQMEPEHLAKMESWLNTEVAV